MGELCHARSLARPFLRIHSLNLFSLLLFSLSSSSTLGRSSDPHQLGRKVVLVVARAAQAPLGQRDRLVLPVPVDAAGRRSPSPVRVAVPVPAAAAAAARGRGLAAARGPLLGLGDPGVDEDVLGGESLVGVLAEEAADEAARAGRDGVGKTELAAPDLGEEALVLLPVEGVPEMMRQTGYYYWNETSHPSLVSIYKTCELVIPNNNNWAKRTSIRVGEEKTQ